MLSVDVCGVAGVEILGGGVGLVGVSLGFVSVVVVGLVGCNSACTSVGNVISRIELASSIILFRKLPSF